MSRPRGGTWVRRGRPPSDRARLPPGVSADEASAPLTIGLSDASRRLAHSGHAPVKRSPRRRVPGSPALENADSCYRSDVAPAIGPLNRHTTLRCGGAGSNLAKVSERDAAADGTASVQKGTLGRVRYQQDGRVVRGRGSRPASSKRRPPSPALARHGVRGVHRVDARRGAARSRRRRHRCGRIHQHVHAHDQGAQPGRLRRTPGVPLHRARLGGRPDQPAARGRGWCLPSCRAPRCEDELGVRPSPTMSGTTCGSPSGCSRRRRGRV